MLFTVTSHSCGSVGIMGKYLKWRQTVLGNESLVSLETLVSARELWCDVVQVKLGTHLSGSEQEDAN